MSVSLQVPHFLIVLNICSSQKGYFNVYTVTIAFQPNKINNDALTECLPSFSGYAKQETRESYSVYRIYQGARFPWLK